MTIKSDIDKNYVIISTADILKCMRDNKKNERVYEECRNIFLNNDVEDNCFKLSSLNPIVLLLKKQREEKYYIDASVLNEALGIAISDNNYEMQKKITKYFRKYMDNERNGLSNIDLISEIVSDNEVIAFIKKHPDFQTYEQDLINKSYQKIQKKISLSKENQLKEEPIYNERCDIMTKKNIGLNFDQLLEKLRTYNDEEELEVVKKAYTYAAKMHFGVKRMTGEDYIEHPLNVAYILAEMNADCATIAAALLHDVLEDCDVTYDELQEMFGKEITDLVDGVTKINKLNFETGSNAVIATQRKILVGLCNDVRVIIIKLADRLHNMRTLWVHTEKKQKEKAKETLDILVPIAHRLGINKMKSELEDLSLRYYRPDIYFDVVQRLNQSKAERDQVVKKMMDDVSALLNEAGIKHEIKGRAKSIFSIYKKMDKGKKFSDIFDLLALRIFVDTEEECYHALGVVHSKYKPMPKRFKDYIAMPKTNMYQSLHTTVLV